MALLILANPMGNDKRKAAVVAVADGDVVDIRGFANFTAFVSAELGGVATIQVCDDPEGTFATLHTLGTDDTAMDTIATTISVAYDIPELAGSHYVKFNGMTSGTIKLMGKV